MTGTGDDSRLILIKAIAVASGGKEMSPLMKVWLQEAKREGSSISDEELTEMFRRKLGLQSEGKEGGSGSQRR